MRVLFLILGALALICGVGYLLLQVYERYGDNPFMLMTLAVPIVAALALLLQMMRR